MVVTKPPRGTVVLSVKPKHNSDLPPRRDIYLLDASPPRDKPCFHFRL